jgi:6-phosphofructokinase 2
VIKEGVTMIKPNLAELSEFAGVTLGNDKDRVDACRKLTAGGHAEIVALTLGDQGALLVTDNKVWRAQPMKIEVASTVGAGDSFLGGMVAALAAGKPLEEAFRVAMAASTAAVMSPGTELSHEADVKRLLPQVQISELETALT